MRLWFGNSLRVAAGASPQEDVGCSSAPVTARVLFKTAALLLPVLGSSLVSGCGAPSGSDSSSAHDGTEILQIGALDFSQPGKVQFVIDMPKKEYYRTDDVPGLTRALFRLLPSLKRQKCRNNYNYTFEREAQETELPHLLEHLSLELQALSRYHGVLKGETSWDWKHDPRGRFHVELSYQYKELAAQSIRSAEKIIETLANDQEAEIDISAELEQLKKVAATPATR